MSKQKELDQAQKQFDAFEQQIKSMDMDNMSKAPLLEEEPQTQMSSSEIKKSKDVYLKPSKTINRADQKFNERFRKDWEFKKEYVHFIAEHKECIGDNIEIWTHPFGGVPAEFWEVPTNKPVWGPRYLAEQIKSRTHSNLVTENAPTYNDGRVSHFGTLVAKNTVQRLDAHPVNKHRSLFGANGF